MERPSFIRMDPPTHDEQRKVVSPIVAPANLANMEGLIRERTLHGARRPAARRDVRLGRPGVDRADDDDAGDAVRLSRGRNGAKLTYWSDVAIGNVNAPGRAGAFGGGALRGAEGDGRDAWPACSTSARRQPPKFDLLSMLAHGEATRNMPLREFMGNLALLIVGGNDTTRNSMTGGLLALHRASRLSIGSCATIPALIPSMVSEIIRYVTPVIHMRRTADEDAELGGKQIRKGDKVVMWYVSGNRDPDAIEDPDRFIIDRPRPRQHLSFGFGIHRCVGNRLAELQLTHPVGGDAAALPGDRGGGRAAADLFQLHPRHPLAAGAHPHVTARWRPGAGRTA